MTILFCLATSTRIHTEQQSSPAPYALQRLRCVLPNHLAFDFLIACLSLCCSSHTMGSNPKKTIITKHSGLAFWIEMAAKSWVLSLSSSCSPVSFSRPWPRSTLGTRLCAIRRGCWACWACWACGRVGRVGEGMLACLLACVCLLSLRTLN